VSCLTPIRFSLSDPQIFGPLGQPNRLHLLHKLRNIRVVMPLDEAGDWAVKRHRVRLAYLVRTLKEHANDANNKSLLKRLHVCVQVLSSNEANSLRLNSEERCCIRNARNYMFALE
jgi:hypothetical protein